MVLQGKRQAHALVSLICFIRKGVQAILSLMCIAMASNLIAMASNLIAMTRLTI